MNLLEKRWVLIALIIFLFSFMYGSAFLLYDEFLSFGLYIVVNIFFFLLSAYFLYRLINLSRWSGRKSWKKALIACVIVILLPPLAFFWYSHAFYCDLHCGGWRCHWECSIQSTDEVTHI